MIRWSTERVDAVVTGRQGGVSTGPYESLNLGLHVDDDPALVLENRRRAASLLADDVGVDDVATCTQVHGRAVVVVDRPGPAGDADALVTVTPGLVLMVLMADCVPVLLVDDGAGVVACVHAGWRGTVADVVGATVDVMRGLGATDIRGFLGPAVPVERYEVGAEVVEAAEAAGVTEALHPSPRGDAALDHRAVEARFDLWAANDLLLRRAGVRDVDLSGCIPTGDGGPYFSDRAHRPCGRFGLLARLRP